MTTGAAGQDELATLDALARAADENAQDERLLARRIGHLRDGRAAGRSWRDLLGGERQPGALQLVARALRRLTDASGTLRRSIATGLKGEGESVATIARRFGVSHQRISTLLRRPPR